MGDGQSHGAGQRSNLKNKIKIVLKINFKLIYIVSSIMGLRKSGRNYLGKNEPTSENHPDRSHRSLAQSR